MMFVTYATDGENGPKLRESLFSAHKEHLERAAEYGVEIVMSGPFVKEDGSTPEGSCFVLTAEEIDDVKRFHQEDPFQVVWSSVTTRRFLRRR